MIAPGTPAPEFSLRDQDGNEVSLSDFRGRKVVLVFYPLDFSPVCSVQHSIYEEILPEVEENAATLVGISVDSSWAHRAFRETLGSTITLLSDFEPKGKVAQAYGAYLDGLGQ
jgi:peroxiredoxin